MSDYLSELLKEKLDLCNRPSKDIVDAVRLSLENRDQRIKDLQKQLDQLKQDLSDSSTSDENINLSIDNLQKKLRAAECEIDNSFSLSKEERESINQWIKNHKKHKHKNKTSYTGAVMESYDYIFSPTSLGILGKVKCIYCNECFTFRDLS